VKKKNNFTWKKLWKSQWHFLEGHRAPYIFWGIVNLIGHSAGFILPFIVGLIIDFFTTYTPGQSLTKFYWYCGYIAIASIGLSVTRLAAKRRLSKYQIIVQHDVKVRGFERLLGFSLAWHDSENTGSKIERINQGANAFNRLIQLQKDQLSSIIMNFIGILGVLAVINYQFLIFFAIYIATFALIEINFNKKNAKLIKERDKAREKASGIYFDSASNILSIKSLGAKTSLATNIRKEEEKTKEIAFRIRDLRTTRMQLVNIINGIAMTLYFLLIGRGIISGAFTVGFVATAFVYFNNVVGNIFRATDVIPDIVERKSAVERLMPLFNTKEDAYFGEKPFPKTWDYLYIKNASFSYGKQKTIKGITLRIHKGEKIGVVGHSGSGKSTLGKLLLGLYKLDAGTVTLGETSFYEISHDEILENISPALQETELFNLSFKDNVTLMQKVNPQLLEKAIEIAQLKPVIQKLPQGINTLVGEKGYKLSGGERQRVGIARAICRNTDIMILDEATSALDTKLETKIQQGIESLTTKTILIIAHRLSTLRNVDRIIVFDKGAIREQGTFKELTKNKNTTFYKLWMEQWKRK